MNMSTPEDKNKTGLPLVHLGVTRPEELALLFADLRGRFDEECGCASDESSWKQFRDAWLGRNSGVLTQITDNGLKPASQELKRVVGQELNQLRAHVESKIEERRKVIEAGTEEGASARERVDLSLPGVIRPLGSHHLIRQVFHQIADIFSSISTPVFSSP